jgi:hypothetical protein
MGCVSLLASSVIDIHNPSVCWCSYFSFYLVIQLLIVLRRPYTRASQTVRRAPWSAQLVLWGGGARCLYKGHIYFEINIGAR